MVKTLPFVEASKTLKIPDLNRNLFSSTDWLAVLLKTYNLKLYVKYIEREGKIESSIVYSVVKNFLEWKICICSYCDYFDCYVKDLHDWKIFLKALREEYPHYRIAIRNLRDGIVRQSDELSVLSKEKFHILDIRDDLDVIWKRTHDSFKSAVKQGQRKGVHIKRCDKKELQEFYRLHLNLRKNKYRLFPQPYRFFDNIWNQFMEKDRGVLLGAFDPSGQFIAGNIYLICGDTFYYKFNTSDPNYLKFRSNNLLFWEGIRFAKERNLNYVDLGSSGETQKGLILFKNHAGAQQFDITHLGFSPPNYRFSQKRILKTSTTIFTSPWMPNFMVKWGSSLIYPFLA